MAVFVEDVRRSIRAIVGVRWLVPVVLVVGLVGVGTTVLAATPVGAVVGLLAPLWLVVWLGWLGTERVIVARAARGEELDTRNVWASVRIVGPRFVRLALALLPVAFLLVFAGAALRTDSLSYRVLLAALVPAVTMAAVAAVATEAIVWVLVAEVLALVVRGATALRYVELVDIAWRDVPGGVWRRRVAVATPGAQGDR